jgi:hypothetical protein
MGVQGRSAITCQQTDMCRALQQGRPSRPMAADDASLNGSPPALLPSSPRRSPSPSRQQQAPPMAVISPARLPAPMDGQRHLQLAHGARLAMAPPLHPSSQMLIPSLTP